MGRRKTNATSVWAGHHFRKLKIAHVSILRTLNKCIQMNSACVRNGSVLTDWLFDVSSLASQGESFSLFDCLPTTRLPVRCSVPLAMCETTTQRTPLLSQVC